MPYACPLPLAACPSPEATHNKADLNKICHFQSECGARVRAVGLAVLGRKSITEKKKNDKRKTPPPATAPAPWTLPHTSPRS